MPDRPLTTRHDVQSSHGIFSASWSSMPRNEYFAALSILGVANGIASRAIQSTAEHGWIDAVFFMFDISAIVWVACLLGIALIFEGQNDRTTTLDLSVGAACIILFALPVGGASWLALTALGFYILLVAGASSSRKRGAMILLAATIPMLWSRLLFRSFSDIILQIDTTLVAAMLGTEQSGNVVRFADGSGDLVILPACSSLANLSLIFPCWVAMSQATKHPWSSKDLVWCFLAGASVVAINVTRMSLMGLNEKYYSMIHGPVGDISTSILLVCFIVGFCMLGVRRELFSRI